MGNIKDLSAKINASIPRLNKIAANAEVLMNKEIEGVISGRIFNDGEKQDGNKIGQYDDTKKQKFLTKKVEGDLTKKQRAKLAKQRLNEGSAHEGLTYKELRKLRGLQVEYVDLQFTGALFRAVQTGTLNGKPAVGVISQKQAKISEHHDEKYGVIFKASDKERNQAIELARDYMFDAIKKEMRTWS